MRRPRKLGEVEGLMLAGETYNTKKTNKNNICHGNDLLQQQTEMKYNKELDADVVNCIWQV